MPRNPTREDLQKRIQALEEESKKGKKAEESLRKSETLFRNLFEQHAAVKLIIDPADGKIIDANIRAAKFYGWTREQIKQMTIQEINTLSLEEIKQEMEKARISKRVHFEFRHRMADGSIRDVDVFRSKIDAGGKELLHSIVHDVTDRKRMEAALQESERRLREAQKMAHLGFWLWDVKTGNVEWSEEVYKIFGLDPQEFTPHIDSILALSPWPEDHQRNRELIERAIEKHDQGSYEQKFLRPDQSIGYYYSTFQGHYDKNGNLLSLFGTVLDITERKRTEEESEKLISELQQALLEVRKLSGLLPMCASCKKIRNYKGYWEQLETYIQQRSEAEFSHGICPDCMKKLYPEICKKIHQDNNS